MIDEILELNKQVCVEDTNKIAIVLDKSKEMVREAIEANYRLLHSIEMAQGDFEYYQPEPRNDKEQLRMICEQYELIRSCMG